MGADVSSSRFVCTFVVRFREGVFVARDALRCNNAKKTESRKFIDLVADIVTITVHRVYLSHLGSQQRLPIEYYEQGIGIEPVGRLYHKRSLRFPVPARERHYAGNTIFSLDYGMYVHALYLAHI